MAVPFLNDDKSPVYVNVPEATVTIGDVPFDNNLGKYTPIVDPQAIFADYKIRNRFEKCRNIYIGGVTSPNGFQGDSASFVQLAAPTLVWICDWTAAKLKVQPEVPNPASSNSNWILLYDSWETTDPGLAADGVTPIFRITGTYVYGHRNPNATTTRDIFYPRPPWMQDFFVRTVDDSLLTRNISDVQTLRNPIGAQ